MARDFKRYRLLPDSPYSNYQSYLDANGGGLLEKAQSLSGRAIVDEVQRSGLRGRGGAGFSTGVKWRTLLDHRCPTRYVVCNAGEGEPGTFKDRFLMRQNPYAVLEGLYIAAHAIQAKAIYIGIKATFKKEIDRLEQAIREMRTESRITAIDINVIPGPSEYLFGEEKAMLNQIESGLPLPREAHYPPYEKGLFARPGSPNPALVNNVETFAHIPSIIRHGSSGFRALGTSDTAGTLLCTISGDVKRSGVYEVEAGIPLGTIIDQFGHGSRSGEIKAVLSGFSAGVIAGNRLETPTDFGSLSAIGSGLGSAGFIILDGKRSMVRVAQTVARFLYVESCNQCPACKAGLRIASETFDGMFEPEDSQVNSIERALAGAHSAPQANRCYLPVQGSLLISSLIKSFKPEFDAQVANVRQNASHFQVPLIVDFDEKTHQFVYDSSFSFKNPDWTYGVPLAS